MTSEKMKNLLIIYLLGLALILSFLTMGGLIAVPILLGLEISPYFYYLFIVSILLIPLAFVAIWQTLNGIGHFINLLEEC